MRAGEDALVVTSLTCAADDVVPDCRSFTYEALPSRVIFGHGTTALLREEAARIGIKRGLVITTPEQESTGQLARQWLGDRFAACFAQARMHTPMATTEIALEFAACANADGLIAIGGGSTVGLSKALSQRTGLPQIAVPTTYAGSEMTPILGETKDGVKVTRRDREILPDVVVYDIDLTLDLPVRMSAVSGLNAMAHAVEALYAPDANPIISMMAEAGLAALARALPKIVDQPGDRGARADALYGAWLCGACLGAVGMSLHHKLCHVLGGSFDLPHAETHAVILPHAAAYNAGATEAMDIVARAIGSESAPDGLFALGRRLGIPASLAALGLPEGGIDKAADLAVQNSYPNPRPIERAGVRELIARAWRGEAPLAA
jgi:alcohol dehydrogenase class IV